MFGEMTTKMAAHVSVDNYEAYIGAKVCDALGVGYNDKVRITFPEAGPSDSDVTVSGFINKAGKVCIGAELCKQVTGNRDPTVTQVEAYVEAVNQKWSDDKEPTEKRFHGSNHLPAENV